MSGSGPQNPEGFCWEEGFYESLRTQLFEVCVVSEGEAGLSLLVAQLTFREGHEIKDQRSRVLSWNPVTPREWREKFAVGESETRNAVCLEGPFPHCTPSSSLLGSLLPTLVSSYMPGHKQDC